MNRNRRNKHRASFTRPPAGTTPLQARLAILAWQRLAETLRRLWGNIREAVANVARAFQHAAHEWQPHELELGA